jgi:hypothetical protein
MVSVNAPVSDRERVLFQAVSQIHLTNARASTKYNFLMHRFNKFPLANSAAKSKMTACERLDLTFRFFIRFLSILTVIHPMVVLFGLPKYSPGGAFLGLR